MNAAGIIIGFVMVALIAGMIVFVSATQSISVVDSSGATYSATANSTNNLVSNVTAVGGTTTGYLVLILAALGLIAGVAILAVYSRK